MLAAEHGVRGAIDRPHSTGTEQRLHAIGADLRPDHEPQIIVEQDGDGFFDRPIDNDRAIAVGQQRFHPTPQVRIVATRLADECQSLGRLAEDGSLEHSDQAVLVVGHGNLSVRTGP